MNGAGDANYYGQSPATLRVEYRAGGVVRFRVSSVGQPEQIVDLEAAVVEQLVDDIQRRER